MKFISIICIIVSASVFTFSPLAQHAHAQAGCAGDTNGDGIVNGVDLAQVLADWGACDGPTISTITPAVGPTSGGTAITISGTSFFGSASVRVGKLAATSVFVTSSTSLTAVTPAGTGVADVTVTTDYGAFTLANAFAYQIALPWATTLEFAPNPAVVTDVAFLARMIATGLPWRVRDNASNIEMLLVPPGVFTMGASPGDVEAQSDESPVHQVTLTGSFYMGKTEVTQGQWIAEMVSNPSTFIGDLNRPVERVTWNMIQPFCAQNGLRLPTEAEWEYACRGGTLSSRYGPIYDICWWLWNNTPNGTKPVATKLPNALGLYDMIGNVWEWNQDWYGVYTSASLTNPTGPVAGSNRLLRGGCWTNLGERQRASRRSYWTPDTVSDHVGFRVARNP